MRQAYDYWQNQPGNYLNAETAPEGNHQGSTPKGAEAVIGRSEDGPKLGRADTLPGEGDAPATIHLPPLSFPNGGPSQRPAQPVKALTGLSYAPLERRVPRAQSRRPRSTGTERSFPPGNLLEIPSQRPTIHRPQPSRRPEPFGVRLSPSPHSHRQIDGFDRVEQEAFAVAGARSGRSTPG